MTPPQKKKTTARFGGQLRPPAWKRRRPIVLVLVLHKPVTYLLTYLDTYSPRDPHGAGECNNKKTVHVYKPPYFMSHLVKRPYVSNTSSKSLTLVFLFNLPINS